MTRTRDITYNYNINSSVNQLLLLINHVHLFIGGHREEHVDEELLVQWDVFQSRKCVEKLSR